MPCWLNAIGSVCVYLLALLYFGIGIYNAYLMNTNCYGTTSPPNAILPYYFKYPFLMNDFLFAILKMGMRNYLKKEDQITQLCK